MNDLARVSALLQEMASTDPERRKAARSSLLQMGAGIQEHLRQILQAGNPILERRARRLLQIIHEGKIISQWHSLIEKPEHEIRIEDGAILIAQCEYPGLEADEISGQLDQLATGVRERLGPATAPSLVLKALNELLFTELGFRGNEQGYYEPENSFLNKVLERRKGIPISLSIVYMAVGRRVGLRLLGVGMPRHFLVKFEARDDERFIDVFGGGKFLTHKGCREMLESFGIEYHPDQLLPTPPAQIYERMLRNLFGIYRESGQTDKALSCLNQLLAIEPESPGDLFLHATLCGILGEVEAAYADLEKLARMPNSGIPKESIARLLHRLIAGTN